MPRACWAIGSTSELSTSYTVLLLSIIVALLLLIYLALIYIPMRLHNNLTLGFAGTLIRADQRDQPHSGKFQIRAGQTRMEEGTKTTCWLRLMSSMVTTNLIRTGRGKMVAKKMGTKMKCSHFNLERKLIEALIY